MGKQVAFAVAVGIAVCGSSGLVFAQSAPPSPAERAASGTPAAQRENTREDRTVVEIVDDAQLSLGGGTVDSRLSELIEKEGAWLDRVTVIGRARSTASPQGQLGQVVWYGLRARGKAEESGEVVEKTAGVRAPLKSSFVSGAPVLPRDTELQAQGDIESLVEDARRLLAEVDGTVPEPEEEEEERTAEAEANEEERRPDQAGGTTLPPGERGNDEAGFEALNVAERAEESVMRASLVSKDGCKPRVDMANRIVVPTSKLVTIEDGQIVSETACTDTAESFPLQWSYQSCEDAVNLDRREAQAQAQPFYVDEFGQPAYVGECQPAAEETFAIVEDFETCSPRVSVEEMVAVRRFSLVYLNRNGVRTVVQGCTEAEGDQSRIPIVESTDACGLRHDMQNNASYRQARLIYAVDGVEHVVQPCSDFGEAIPHIVDAAACSPVVDRATGKAIPRGRRLLELGDGMQQVLAECAPLPDMAEDLRTTTEGCEYAFVHNLEAGQSLPTQRWFHTLSGQREYVSSCEPSDAPALVHEYETVGWQNDDVRREAVPVERVFIVAPVGEVEISGGRVRAGVPAVPYQYVGETDAARPAGKYHQGCNAYTPTDRVREYRRPDTTAMHVVIGEGDVLGPVDECVRTTEQRNAFSHFTYSATNNPVRVTFNSGAVAWYGHPGSGTGSGGPHSHCTVEYQGSGGEWPAGSITFQNFFLNQTRTAIQQPNGAVTHTPWAAAGAPYVQSSFACSWQAYSFDNR